MRRDIQNNIAKTVVNVLMMVTCLFIVTSCNKDFDTSLRDSYPEDALGVGDGDKKVLYIIMDGVRGTILKDLATPNLTEITKRAIFTYDGIADYQRNPLTQAAAWTTMLSGVDYTKHHVKSDDFAGFDASVTPTLFSRIKTELDDTRTVSFSTNANLNEYLAKDATLAETYSTDLEVKSAVIQELDTENPSLLLVQFHGADLAASGDYTMTNQAYVDAIKGIDGSIGDIMTALRARKTFASENWLVVIAVSKSGGVSGTSAGDDIYNDPSRNTFVAYYNPKFKTEQFAKPDVDGLPYTGSAPRFISNNGNINGRAHLGSNTTIGNFGTPGNYTFMFKMRDNISIVTRWITIIGKRNPDDTGFGTGGWSFAPGSVGSMQLDWNNSPRPASGALIDTKDLKWHTIGFTVSLEAGVKYLRVYYDGKLVNDKVVITNSNPNNNFPMLIGSDRNLITDLLFRDIVMLDVALTEQDMAKYMPKEFGPTNPYFSNAIGWWPANESSGSKLYDRSGNDNDFILNSDVQFATFSDLSPNVSPNISEAAFKVVPNGVDIPVMIYNWMNIVVSEDWGLMGKFYMPTVNLPKD